jgi:hypothetical protein
VIISYKGSSAENATERAKRNLDEAKGKDLRAKANFEANANTPEAIRKREARAAKKRRAETGIDKPFPSGQIIAVSQPSSKRNLEELGYNRQDIIGRLVARRAKTA